jgi:hypothetical protein
MSPRQCEIAAESYTACLLAQCGYDVLVQYGANQPHYDLIAVRGNRFLPVSVKGSQDGGWMLAVRYVGNGVTYHAAIDKWLSAQREDVLFAFVQFIHVSLGQAPRVYLARPPEIAGHLKLQRDGLGHGALHENYGQENPRSKYKHKIPDHWSFSDERLDTV